MLRRQTWVPWERVEIGGGCTRTVYAVYYSTELFPRSLLLSSMATALFLCLIRWKSELSVSRHSDFQRTHQAAVALCGITRLIWLYLIRSDGSGRLPRGTSTRSRRVGITIQGPRT
ncbi:hypothetical protein BDW74DRAFT_163948 [Aspergillus multicolor]|uniref:uncharacterized protein n=1 Tax=Aspergillus multicolor TaxID=41759 RepID=UPI003CCCAEEE